MRTDLPYKKFKIPFGMYTKPMTDSLGQKWYVYQKRTRNIAGSMTRTARRNNTERITNATNMQIQISNVTQLNDEIIEDSLRTNRIAQDQMDIDVDSGSFPDFGGNNDNETNDGEMKPKRI
jgi:hypothetical protein